MAWKYERTYVGEVMDRDMDEARRLVRRALCEVNGSSLDAARKLDISRPFMFYVLKRLGIKDEPKMLRETLKKRFRIPP